MVTGGSSGFGAGGGTAAHGSEGSDTSDLVPHVVAKDTRASSAVLVGRPVTLQEEHSERWARPVSSSTGLHGACTPAGRISSMYSAAITDGDQVISIAPGSCPGVRQGLGRAGSGGCSAAGAPGSSVATRVSASSAKAWTPLLSRRETAPTPGNCAAAYPAPPAAHASATLVAPCLEKKWKSSASVTSAGRPATSTLSANAWQCRTASWSWPPRGRPTAKRPSTDAAGRRVFSRHTSWASGGVSSRAPGTQKDTSSPSSKRSCPTASAPTATESVPSASAMPLLLTMPAQARPPGPAGRGARTTVPRSFCSRLASAACG
mmetsp:Transcript_87744/g.228933  ORF Transcript_87744/g.228933 Transcript_87744/m.228933 type:complete len:319 (+) Transcript_87744:972-1928(+)